MGSRRRTRARSAVSCGYFFGPQEFDDRIDEARPRRLVREDKVILALERQEASVTDLTRQHADEGAERIQKETTICYSGASSYAQNQGVEHDGEHASAR